MSVARRRARAEAKLRRAKELYLESVMERANYDRAVREVKAKLDALRPVSRPEVELASY